MVRNRIFWTIGEHLYIFYCPMMYYRRMEVYEVETMDMRRSHWNNGVSGMVLISIVVSTMVFIVRDRILW